MGTIVKRDLNYNKKNIVGLIHSLRHSLRMAQNEYDEFESDPKLRHLNKVEIDGKIIDFNDFDCDEFIKDYENKLLKTIDATSINPEDEKQKNYLRSLRKKINDFSVSNSFEIAEFINNSIENKSVNTEEYSSLLNREGIKRINQKVDLLSRYIAVSSQVSEPKIGDNINRVKEIILVIPSTNNLPNIDKYGDFTRETLNGFYKDNFKDFDIVISMSHLDETTPHAHLFLDLQNNKTGQYDFSVKELEFAIQYSQNMKNAKKMPLFEDYELKNRTIERQDYIYKKELNSWKSSIVQSAFYDYFNEKSFEIELGFTAEKLAPSKDRDKRNKIIEEEAKKPKAERNFNYYAKKIGDMELKIESLTNELNNSKEEKNKIKEELNTLNEKFKKGTTAVSKLKTDENKLNSEIENNKNIINQQSKSIEEQKKSIAQQSKSIENYKKTIKEQEETIEDLKLNNTKLQAAYEVLSDKFKNLQRDTIKEVMNIFNKMKNLSVNLTSDYHEPGKSFSLKVIDFFKKGKEQVSGLSAFLTKAEYSDDEQLEEKILEEAKPQFNTNLFMTLSIVNGLFNDKVFSKENKDLKIINDKIIKNVLKDKKEDDFVEIIKNKDIRVYKDHIPDEDIDQYVEYEEKKRNKLKPK